MALAARSRYRRFLWFSAKALTATLIWDVVFVKIGLGGISRRTRPARMRKLAKSFRNVAITLGIKAKMQSILREISLFGLMSASQELCGVIQPDAS